VEGVSLCGALKVSIEDQADLYQRAVALTQGVLAPNGYG
jgi:hypothetical protein